MLVLAGAKDEDCWILFFRGGNMYLSTPGWPGALSIVCRDVTVLVSEYNILLCQDFLGVAVSPPWARAISQNGVPYYIKYVLYNKILTNHTFSSTPITTSERPESDNT